MTKVPVKRMIRTHMIELRRIDGAPDRVADSIGKLCEMIEEEAAPHGWTMESLNTCPLTGKLAGWLLITITAISQLP